MARSYPRAQYRYAFPEGSRVSIAFAVPGESLRAMPLVDLSGSGLSFRLAPGTPGVEVGQQIPEALLAVGHHRIRGEIRILHVTSEHLGARCGGRFFPSSPRDERALRAVLAWLDSVARSQASVG